MEIAQVIDNYLATGETFLNRIDWVPFFSSYSGMVRILAGAIQLAAGAVFTYLKYIHLILTDSKKQLKVALNETGIYCLHGMLNISRGALAMIPGLNLLLWIHDHRLGRYNYLKEKVKSGVYPIATARCFSTI